MKKIILMLLAALLICLHPAAASALFYNELYSDRQYIVSINPNYVADLGDVPAIRPSKAERRSLSSAQQAAVDAAVAEDDRG